MRSRSIMLIVAAAVAGCGGDEDTPRPAATAAATPSPTETPAASAEIGSPAVVSSEANIFGAGLDEPPAPAAGGAGELPVEFRLPEGARVVRIAEVSGEVTPLSDSEGTFPTEGAEGAETAAWKLPGAGTISGLSHPSRRMFLTGVFLKDGPSEKAPPAMRYGRRIPARQSPRIGQTFYMGHGRGRTFRVPKGATRVFLGFADFKRNESRRGTGDYGNNRGELTVTLEAS